MRARLGSKGGFLQQRRLSGSETEVGKVAVSDGNAGACHQQVIEADHEAAEKRGGRREAERGGFGHLVPLSLYSRSLCCLLRGNLRIPDASGNGFVCIAAFYILQCSKSASSVPIAKRGPEHKGRPNRTALEVIEKTRSLIRRRPSAAGRVRRNRGSPPPDGR